MLILWEGCFGETKREAAASVVLQPMSSTFYLPTQIVFCSQEINKGDIMGMVFWRTKRGASTTVELY